MKNRCEQNISFYYYGQEHLILNVYKYIKGQVEQNNFVFLYCDDNITDMMNKNLNVNEQEMVGKIELDKVVINALSTLRDLNSLNEKIEFLKENGFWGGVIVVDAAFLIDHVGEINFLEYIKTLSNVCKENNLNIMTCYDFSDYINRGKKINEEIIKASYIHHDYRLYANKIMDAEKFNIYSNLA
ncbi:MAG: MEDS domain-containing protein [Clostridium sp.]